MATKEITFKESSGVFSLFKKTPNSKKNYNFEGISSLRQLLSNEKARILNVIKNQEPKSIYDLAKKLNRNFKSVRDDIKTLEKFGFVQLKKQKTKNRIQHKPIIKADTITIHLKI